MCPAIDGPRKMGSKVSLMVLCLIILSQDVCSFAFNKKYILLLCNASQLQFPLTPSLQINLSLPPPLRKQQASWGHQSNMVSQTTVRPGTYHHIKAREGSSIEGKGHTCRKESGTIHTPTVWVCTRKQGYSAIKYMQRT